MSIASEVIDIVAEQLGVDRNDVAEDKSLVEDLNADSLDLTELVMALESHFDCEFSESEANDIKTVGDAIRNIESKKNA
ncbi:MAG: acpP [Chlamydiales bacterium]|nr:acpP [Chlamydiales bacterium]